jgi:hypothetical protein
VTATLVFVGVSCSATIDVGTFVGVSSIFGGEEDGEDAEEKPDMGLDVSSWRGIDEIYEEKSEGVDGVPKSPGLILRGVTEGVATGGKPKLKDVLDPGVVVVEAMLNKGLVLGFEAPALKSNFCTLGP